MTLSRREFLGLSSLLIASCAVPTHSIADDDDMPPRPAPPPRRQCVATADNIEGPFYKEGAPHNEDARSRTKLASSRDKGTPFLTHRNRSLCELRASRERRDRHLAR